APRPPLFPYTTLFRSEGGGSAPAGAAAPRPLDGRPRRGKRRGRQRLGRRGRTWVGSGRRGRRNGTVLAAHRGGAPCAFGRAGERSEEHTSELQSRENL